MSETKVNPYKVISKLQERDFIVKSVAYAYEGFTGEQLPKDLPRNKAEREICERAFYALNDLFQTVGLRDTEDAEFLTRLGNLWQNVGTQSEAEQ